MNSNVYVQTARDLGQSIDADGKTHYYVGNGLTQLGLHPIEFYIWKEAVRMESISEWRQAMADKIKSKTKVSFERIEKKLLDKKLLHSLQFENENDDALSEIFIVRNAFAYGEREGTWVIAPHDNKTKLKLSQEHYEIWVIPSSYKSLLEIILEFKEKHNYTMEHSIQVVSTIARRLIRTELWTVEYLSVEEF